MRQLSKNLPKKYTNIYVLNTLHHTFIEVPENKG